jgi:hypothetical protein
MDRCTNEIVTLAPSISELQHWVSATDIRISLMRLNTFGDEVFGDPKVLRSYYYAITDFTVGGRYETVASCC